SQWWTGFPDTRAADIADFLALCRRGRAMEVAIPPEGMSQKAFDQILQRNEFLKSVGFLRVHGAGQIG
ncbi:hypothetical protein N9D23_15280, partial [Rubripirellula sp.]|nr:hypothetical protein [Rubripirellula sp.]